MATRAGYDKVRADAFAHFGGQCACGMADHRCLQIVPARPGVKINRNTGGETRMRQQMQAPAGDYKLQCANCKAIDQYEADASAAKKKAKDTVPASGTMVAGYMVI